MPGSIHVSVVDLKELPPSSSFVKVSLGKVEHEARENETFSFPLTNLRDNLIITIQDADGNQVSHSGVTTMLIIEKGTWDDVFPIQGGGLIRMKLEFVLSDEERNRIRLMRESAMKKKEAEILSSRLRNADSAQILASSLRRHEVSDVLRAKSSEDFQKSSFNNAAAKNGLSTSIDPSVKVLKSSDGIEEESFQRQLFTNATDRKDETSSSLLTERTDSPTASANKNKAAEPNTSANFSKKISEQNHEYKSISESTSTPLLQETQASSNKNNEIQLELPEIPKISLEGDQVATVEAIDSLNLMKKNNSAKSSLDHDMGKQSKSSPILQENATKPITSGKNQSQQADVSTSFHGSSAHDVGSSRSTIAEKIKSFSPKLIDEPDKQGSSEKTPRNIKKMISVFESSVSQDRVPLKPLGTKPYRAGTLRSLNDMLIKDYNEKSESSLKNSETLSRTRLRTSFSTGDLRKNLSSIITKEDQDASNNSFVEPSETNMQLNKNDPEGKVKLPKDSVVATDRNVTVNNEEKTAFTETNTNSVQNSCEEDAATSGRMSPGRSLLGGRKIGEIGHEEKIVASKPQVVMKDEVDHGGAEVLNQGENMAHISENMSPTIEDEEAYNGSLGQAIKIALVIGFGVLVLLFRQREPGKSKKKENTHALKNQVFMNKRGSLEEQRRKIGTLKLS
uniref:uncharacterized protein LOC122595600 isoform X2 n=1 Tax=Erigeron canadensis TaxID=72917 RepID=UPI001CB98B28|nr:uncharacterized protein LOC122595600 isoform X2 [Erigeron canadensis]